MATDFVPIENLCQLEIPVTDLQKSRLFYEEVFGWRAVPVEMHERVVFEVAAANSYGVMLTRQENQRPDDSYSQARGVIPYFKVLSGAALLAKVVSAGGALASGPSTVPGYGIIWKIVDLDGNITGIFEPLPSR